MDTTPVSLIERLSRRPEESAWKRFVDLYTPLLYFWAQKGGLPSDRAADVVQEVFLTLLEQLPRFQYDPKGSFRGWLRSILLHKCHDYHRRAARQVNAGSALEHLEDETPGGEELFTLREYREHLAGRAMRLMRAEFQPVTWQACWETAVRNRPAAEVARELGISVNAVWLAKSRVLRRLRRELEGLLE
jgi:RNA polymerase sigma-70 factor, ECF subfamily